MSTTTPDTELRVAPTPDLADLATVAPIPFDLHTAEFDEPGHDLTADAAHAILSEIWRLSRNPRLLEIERETRGHMVPDLQLASLAATHTVNGEIDATAAAREFISTVRSEYPHQLVNGPVSQWAVHAAPAELDTLTVE